MWKMLRRVLWVAMLLAALGILVTAVLAFVIVPRPAVQEWLGETLSRAAGPAVAFEAVSLAFWPEPGVRLHAVRLGADARGAATASSLSCTLELAALLSGEVVIDEVTVVRPVASAFRAADGRWSFGGGLERLVAAAFGLPSRAAEGRPPTPRRVTISGGSFDLEDRRVEGGPVKLQLRNVAASLRPPRDRERGSLQLSFDESEKSHLEVTATLEPVGAGASFGNMAFAAEVRGRSLDSDRALLYLLFGLPIRNGAGVFDIAGTVSGRLSGAIEGNARIDLSDGVVEGWGIRMGTPMSLAAGFAVTDGKFRMREAHLEAATSGFAGFTGERSVADFEWVEHALNVAKLDVGAYGGRWTASGSVDFEGTPSYAGEIAAADVAFDELARALSAQPTGGGFDRFDAEATVRGSWPGPDDWQRNLGGSGSVRMAGGQLESSRVLRSVFRALFGKLPGIGRIARDEKPTMLESLVATFSLAGGRAQTEDLVFLTSDYRMEGRGSIGFDGTLQLATLVSLTARGIQKVYVFAAMPFRKSGAHGLPALPVDVTGTVAAPNVRPDLTGISLSPFRAFFGGAGNALGKIIDVAIPGGDATEDPAPQMEE